MSESSHIKVNYGVICDDARREDNGKLILIGVYGGSIRVPSVPATLVLSMALSCQSAGETEKSVEFRISLNGISHAEGTGTIRLPKAGTALTVIPGIVLSLEKTGILEFDIKFEGQEWQTAARLPFLSRSELTSSPPESGPST